MLHAPRKDENKSRKSKLCPGQNHLSVTENSTSNMSKYLIRKHAHIKPAEEPHLITDNSEKIRSAEDQE